MQHQPLSLPSCIKFLKADSASLMMTLHDWRLYLWIEVNELPLSSGTGLQHRFAYSSNVLLHCRVFQLGDSDVCYGCTLTPFYYSVSRRLYTSRN